MFGLALIPIRFLPIHWNRMSSVTLWFLYVILIGPAICLIPTTVYAPIPLAMAYSLLLLLGFLIAILFAGKSDPKPLFWKKSTLSVPVAIFCLVTVFVHVVLNRVSPISFNLPQLSDIYDVRGDYQDAVIQSPLVMPLVGLQSNCINPIMMVIGGHNMRRIWLLVVAVVSQLILFSATGMKTALFSAPIIIVLLIWGRWAKARPIHVVVAALAVPVIALIIDGITHGHAWTSYFVRRLVLAPSTLSGAYFEYFSTHELNYLGGIIRRVFGLQPSLPPAYQVSDYLIGQTVSMNANSFAAGFADFGVLGVFIVGAVIGLFLRFLDRASVGLPMSYLLPLCLYPTITLSNAAIQTSLITNGLIAIPFALAMMPLGVRSALNPSPGISSPNTENHSSYNWLSGIASHPNHSVVHERVSLHPDAVHSRKK